jgi:hypothetical protein
LSKIGWRDSDHAEWLAVENHLPARQVLIAAQPALMVMSLERQLNNDAEITLAAGGTRESRQRSRRSDKTVELIGERLLNAGCDVNAVDNKGRAPLIYAVASERLGVVKSLLKGGANIHARDHNGESALDWARKNGNDEVIMLLTTFSPSGGVEK